MRRPGAARGRERQGRERQGRERRGRERRGRAASQLTAESALLGLVVGVAVVAPWTTGGYLLLLDWVSGPQQAITPGLYGLDPNALDAMPFRLATQGVRELVGPRVTAWLVVFAYFPVAAGGASALAGGGRWRRYPAAFVMVCNPFVFERVRAGHVTFLLSVSVLTWLFASAVYARRRGKPFAARPAGWYALAMAIGPHGAFLGGVGLVAIALLPRPRVRDTFRTAVIVLSAGLAYLYAAVVMISGVPTMRVTELDLEAYATHAGPGGLLPTVASLHGFWRGGAGLPRDRLGPWLGLLVFAVLLATVVAGLVALCRRHAELGAPLVAITVVGLLLGAGVDGPAGAVYRFAFRVVPLFEAMREQQKWVALAMIAYAVAVGGAVEALVYAVRHHRLGRLPAFCGAAAVGAACLSLAPSLVWGLGGSIPVVRYPASWYAADRIMGEGTGKVLFLPWHGYQPFDFTGGRTVATPAPAFFRRPVLSSDAVELGALRTNSISRRRAYVERLIADGGGGPRAGGRFGRLIAPLGVEYVLVAREREDAAYGWVPRQVDLRPVLRSDELDLYRVVPAGTGRVGSARSAGYAEAVALAGRDELGTEALLPESGDEGPLPSAAAGAARRSSSTRWRIEPGAPGWVVLPEEWSPGWRAPAASSRPTLAGTVALRVGAGPTTVEYTPWRWLRVGLAASLLAFAALVVAGLVEHRRELSGWWHRRSGREPAPVPRAPARRPLTRPG